MIVSYYTSKGLKAALTFKKLPLERGDMAKDLHEQTLLLSWCVEKLLRSNPIVQSLKGF